MPGLQEIRHVALDMDGTLYRGSTLFDFSIPFLDRLRELEIGYTFLTNNCSRSVQDYVLALQRRGIGASPDQVYTSGLCTIDHLRREMRGISRLFVLGTPSLFQELRAAGFYITSPEDEPEAVVVAFDTALSYERLCKAAWWIRQGKPFIATHPDRNCPTDQATVLVDCGAVCACLQAATGRAPDAVLGKPHPSMLRGLLQRHELQPHQLAMVGDRLNTDVAMARRTGALAVLVMTGETTEQEVAGAAEPPDLILPSIKEFGDMLAAARAGVGR
jgi:NagD protein